MAVDLKSLQQELSDTLSRAEHSRKIIRLVKTPIFAAFLLWIVLLFCMPFALHHLVRLGIVTPGANIQQFIMPYFIGTAIVMVVLNFTFSRAMQSFARIEHEAIGRIVRELFPTAKLHATPQPVPGNILKNSMLFNSLDSYNNVPALVFASLELPSQNHTLQVVDLGVTQQRAGASALFGMYAEIFRQIFKSRTEMASYLFRGMFAWVELEKRLPGSIVIMPDHLEDTLGYLAKHVQSMKNRGDMKLVQLEDTEFERFFAVYTSDEVLARYVLTPAMMRDITALRHKYGRDIMISFNANRFCIAVAMPDGFLNLRSKAIKNGNIVEEIYSDILTTQSILTQVELDKIA